MAKYSNTVEYNLRTTLDDSGIAKLQAEIRQVQNEIQRLSSMDMLGKNQVNSAIGELDKLKNALNQSFNANLGMLDTKRFASAMRENGASIGSLNTAFKTAGVQGEMAFNNLVGRLGKLDTGIKSVSKTTDKVFNTIGNTVRWGIIASGFQSVMNSAHQAVDYVRELDRSLNDIRIVSEYNAEQMRDFSLSANEAAKSLGQTTVAYTDASLIFAQQGYNLADSEKLANLTLKVANTTGQQTSEVSEQLTSWINGYQMSLSELEGTLDKVTKVAAVGASDTEELMTAAARVASTASTLGVTEDQLISQMSTIISVTREAPENVGNALKTIYARLGDLQMGETLEDGTSLGNLSGTLEKVGVQVLDDTNAMRSMGDIMEDLMGKWDSFDTGEKQALAVKLAGKYQYNRLMALMENAEMYGETMEASGDSEGFLQRTQDIYMESINAKINALQAAGEGLITTLFDGNEMAPMIDSLTTVLELFNDMIDSIGGSQAALTGLGAVATKVFSQQMSRGINNIISNKEADKKSKANPEYAQGMLSSLGLQDASSEKNKELINFAIEGLQRAGQMSQEQQDIYNQRLEKTVALKNQQLQLESEIEKRIIATNAAYRLAGASEDMAGINRDPETQQISSVDTSTFMNNVNEAGSDYYLKTKQIENLDFSGARGAIADASQATQAIGESLRIANREASLLGEADSPFFDSLVIAESNIKDLSKELALTGRSADEVKQAFEELWNIAVGDGNEPAEISEVAGAYEKLRQEVLKVQSVLQESNVGELISSDVELRELDSKLAGIHGAEDFNQEENKEFFSGLDRQGEIEGLVNAAGAIGQLSFSWQTFQSLGSLWANSDISGGEKLLQTVMNLGMSLPMLISSFAELNKIANSDSFAKLSERLMNNAEANRKSALEAKATTAATTAAGIAATGTAAKFNIMGTASSVASKGVNVLGKALSFLGGPIGMAITTAFMAISGVVSAYSESVAQAYNDAKDKAAETLSSYQELSSQIDSFDTLYKSYEDTGVATDELKDTAQQLADTLDIQGASADIAAGNFEKLAQSISDADAEQRKYAERDIESFLSGSNKDSLEGNFLGIGNGSMYQDLKAAVDLEFEGAGRNRTISQDSLDTLSKFTAAEQNNSPAEAVRAARETIDNYNKEIDSIESDIKNAKLNGEDTSALEETKQSYLKRIDDMNNALNQDDIKDYIEQSGALAELNAQDIQAKLTEDATYQDIIDAYMDNDATSAYLTAMTNWSDQLSWMIQHTTDATAKLALQLEQAYTTSGQDLYGKVSDSITQQNINTSDFGVSDSGVYTDAMVKDLQDQIKNSGLTQQEQLEFIASLDMNASLGEIQNQIQSINTSGSLPKLSFEPELSDRSDFSDEQIDDLLKESGMSEAGFNRMSSGIFESDEIQSQASAIEDQIKILEESGDVSEETADKIKELRQEYEDLGDTSEDIAAYNLQMNKGVSRLVNSWEDLGDVLQDDAAKGTSDYYEALGELDEIMSDILNIDTGVLSEDFYNNAEAIEAMGRAAEGDVSAIDDLRALASEDLILNLDVQGITPEDKDFLINNELLPMLTEMQTLLDGQPLGTSVDVDTNPFIMKLNDLLAKGQITADQATNILSSIGMDANIDMKTATSVQQHQAQYPTFSVETDPETGMLTGLTPTGVKTVTWESEDEISYPTIKGATYTGPGVQTVGGSSSGNSGKKSGGGGGGGKGGGGGGSGKTYEPKKKDPIEEEIDRYERIDTLLQAIENDFDKIADEQDRLTGYQQADNMSKQIALLQKQIALQKEKLEIQREEARELRDQLASQYGVSFDAEGFITNYANTHRRLESEVNSLINRYNSTTSESGQEALEKQIESAQEKLEKFKTQYQRYDDLVSGDLKDTQKAIEDLKDSIEDLRIEAFKTAVEAVDNIRDIQEQLIDFNDVFSGLGKDDPFRAMGNSVAKLKKYFDVATTSVNGYYDTLIARSKEQLKDSDISDSRRKWLEQQIALMQKAKSAAGNQTMEEYGTGYLDMELLNLENIMAQIKQFEETGSSSIFGENSADLYEVAKDIFNSATDMIIDYEDQIEDLRDAILDAIDEVADKMESRREAYENISEELQHQADIIELLHGENAYEEINKVLSAQQNNYRTQISEMQQQLSIWRDMQTAMEAGSEEWKAIQEQITDTQKEINDLVTESLENLQQQYSNTVNKVLDAWTDNALGNDLDWIVEEWELINRNADYYLDQTNAAYAIQKLQGKYLELLDGSNDLHVQQQITGQMKEQLAYLREKKNLSEYDVAYANAQLEILQKRIALEEAQKNKSQMKLKRDSQGNYSYVYTANQDDVAGAEGDLLDAQNNAYNLSKDQMKQTQDDSLSALQDAKNLINQIWNDANLTLEEKQKRTQTIINSLKEYLAATSEQLSTSEKNIINDFIGMVELMTDENAERLDEVYQQIIGGNTDAFDQIDTRWSTSITKWLSNMDEFNDSTDSMFEGLISNAKNYQSQINQVGSLVGTDFNNMADSIQNAVDKTNDLASSTSDFINQLKNDAGTIKEYENVLQDYAKKISDVTNEMKAYQDQVNDLATKLTAKEQENANLNSQVKDLQGQVDAWKNAASNGGGGGGGGSSAASNPRVGDWVGFNGWYYYDSWGAAPAGNHYAGQAGSVKIDSYSNSRYGGNARNTGGYDVHITGANGWDLGWVKQAQLFDTGGYTGNWTDGSDTAKNGKLAWLHQKEIVLNQEDSYNILKAVNSVRAMTENLKSGAFDAIISRLNDQGSYMIDPNVNSQEIQQQVEINATFPNVKSAEEVEGAILSLVDQAAQYAFRQ